MVIAYIMAKQRKTYEQAHKALKDKRPIIKPNDNFIEQLMKFEIQLIKFTIESSDDEEEDKWEQDSDELENEITDLKVSKKKVKEKSKYKKPKYSEKLVEPHKSKDIFKKEYSFKLTKASDF